MTAETFVSNMRQRFDRFGRSSIYLYFKTFFDLAAFVAIYVCVVLQVVCFKFPCPLSLFELTVDYV